MRELWRFPRGHTNWCKHGGLNDEWYPRDGLSEEISEGLRAIVDATENVQPAEDSPDEIPGWRMLEEVGAGAGTETEYELCGKPGTPRRQFERRRFT